MNNYTETIAGIWGWICSSLIAGVILGFLFGVLGFTFWDDLSWGIKIPVLLFIGACYFVPRWKKRVR